MKGFEHLTDDWVAVLRWLAEARVEHVVVGPVGEAIRGRVGAHGPVAIVPAPYHRNLDRLAHALVAARGRRRSEDGDEWAPMRFRADTLVAGERWMLRCDVSYDLDIEMSPASRYSELLYEAGRFEIEPGLSVEVASDEVLEHHSQAVLGELEPEIRVTRGPAVPRSSS